MKNRLTLFQASLYLFLIAPASFAQDTLQLTLTPLSEPRFNGSYRGLQIKSTEEFRGFPKAMDHQIYLFNFQRRQSTLTNYRKGILNGKQFNEIVQAYKLDTAGLYQKPDINNSLAVLSALYPGNRKKIIPDLNFNLDFSDDPVYEYTVPDFDDKYPVDSLPTLRVPYDYVYEGKPIRREMLLKIPPTSEGHTLANADDKPLLLTAHFSFWRSTRIKLNDTMYEITLGMPQDIDANYTQASALQVSDLSTNSPVKIEPYPRPGVFFPLGGKMVKVENISYFGDTAQLIVK